MLPGDPCHKQVLRGKNEFGIYKNKEKINIVVYNDWGVQIRKQEVKFGKLKNKFKVILIIKWSSTTFTVKISGYIDGRGSIGERHEGSDVFLWFNLAAKCGMELDEWRNHYGG